MRRAVIIPTQHSVNCHVVVIDNATFKQLSC